MAKGNKKEWALVDRLIGFSDLPVSTKEEVRKIAKEYNVQPFKALQMAINPIYLLEAVLKKMPAKEQRMIAKALVKLMKSGNWREKLKAAMDRVDARIKTGPR